MASSSDKPQNAAGDAKKPRKFDKPVASLNINLNINGTRVDLFTAYTEGEKAAGKALAENNWELEGTVPFLAEVEVDAAAGRKLGETLWLKDKTLEAGTTITEETIAVLKEEGKEEVPVLAPATLASLLEKLGVADDLDSSLIAEKPSLDMLGVKYATEEKTLWIAASVAAADAVRLDFFFVWNPPHKEDEQGKPQKTDKASSGDKPALKDHPYLFGTDIRGPDDATPLLSLAPPVKLPLLNGVMEGLALRNIRITWASEAMEEVPLPSIAGDKAIVDSTPEPKLPRGISVAATLTVGGETKETGLGSETPAGAAAGSAAPPAEKPDAPAPKAPPTQQEVWFPVQKTFGPFSLRRVGILWTGKRIGFIFDAGIKISALSIGLDGLGITLPPNNPSIDDIEGTIDGLDIAYTPSNQFQLAGGLLKTGQMFVGDVILKTKAFSLAAIGGYGSFPTPTKDDPNAESTTLFVFGVFARPLGGPSFFYVTGVAGGFGYNSRLKMPDINQLSSFPFIKLALSGKPGPAEKGDAPADAGDAAGADLRALVRGVNRYVIPTKKEYWLALGVRFTSYEMIQSFAMVSVSFGVAFELDVMGLSQMAVPTPPSAGSADSGVSRIAYAEVALLAVFNPEEGILRVDAKLTPASYVLSQKCQIVGGFAFYVWFKEGDFVITFGGYNPHYDKPAHYPSVPRLGILWNISDQLQIKGGAYFALTSAAIMAGGFLSATFQSGPIRAWFDAGADFLLQWKPFKYAIDVYINLGASFTIHVLVTIRMSIHVGVGLSLWGPPFGGRAKIDLSVISFTIKFGAAPPAGPKLTWDEFATAFLPKGKKGEAGHVIKARTTGGLLKDFTVNRQEVQADVAADAVAEVASAPSADWKLDPLHFAIEAHCAVPAHSLTVTLAPDPSATGANPTTVTLPADKIYAAPAPQPATDGSLPADGTVPGNTPATWETAALGIPPMGILDAAGFESSLTVTLTRDDATSAADLAQRLHFSAILGNSPKALYGQTDLTDTSNHGAALKKESNIPNTLRGVRITPAVRPIDKLRPASLNNLQFGDAASNATPMAASIPSWTAVDQQASLAETIAASAVAQTRADIATALAGYGVPVAAADITLQSRDEAVAMAATLYHAPRLSNLQ